MDWVGFARIGNGDHPLRVPARLARLVSQANDTVWWLWVPDAQQSALQYRHRSSKAVRIGKGGEVGDCLCGCGGGLVGQAQHHDAGMASGRVGADVAQAAVQ